MKMMLVQLLALTLVVGSQVSGYPQDRLMPENTLAQIEILENIRITFNATGINYPQDILFFLYTRRNPKTPQQLLVNNSQLLNESFFNCRNPTKFITHGWTTNGTSPSCILVKDAFLEVGDYNVIIVDWNTTASGSYLNAASHVKSVGKYVATMIEFVEKQKTSLKSMTLVGHSLGSHVMGIAGNFLRRPVAHIVDGAPVHEQDKTGYEDSMAAASETGGHEEAYDDGNDSDMYMEPDGAESTHAEARHETDPEAPISQQPETQRPVEPQPQRSAVPHVTIVAVRPVQTSIQVSSSESTESSSSSSGSHTEEKPEQEERSLETDSQNFFPSFAELFGAHRLPFNEQQRYRPSRFLGYFQRDRPYTAVAAATKEAAQPAILGSGNFGVIRGGTYYPEDKEADEYNVDDAVYNPFYHGNGRGRAYYKNPKPQPVRGGDFFANFRDFADITAPPKSSFSHLSVVYANKNGSSAGRAPEQPRNIIETLRMLEEEEEAGLVSTTTTEMPQKKLSQGKRKLIKIKKYQEEKARKSRMTIEPLLALS